MLDLPLERLQAWMQVVIAHRGSEDEAVVSPEAQELVPAARIGEVILPSRRLTPVERIGVYQGMYLLRMAEALESDYTALAHSLGHEGFHALVSAFVQVHPSRSYTFNDLGARLPEFVLAAPSLKRRGFLHDLARLEQAVAQVFEAAETKALSAETIAAVGPDEWERARLQTVEAFRLLSLRYNANDYLQSLRDDNHRHPRPRLAECHLAIYRRDYSVYRLELTRPAHDLLADLAGGTRLGEALAAALERGRPAPREDHLFRWFREWVAAGIFRSVALD